MLLVSASAISLSSWLSESIRLLHLSDLHFNDGTQPKSKLQWLLQDIRKDLGFDTVEYLVISGDMSDKGSEQGFEKAREFVSLLNEELGVSAERCIFVPGNHDVQTLKQAYDLHLSEAQARLAEPDESQWHREGNVILVPNRQEYPQRLRKFSEAFFHKIIQNPYPLEYARQGIAYSFPKKGIQFLTLNSCWQVDHFHRKRSGVHPEAVARVIEEADQADRQETNAARRGEMKKNRLRIGVWHHPIQHLKGMRNTDLIENLQKAGVRICLHGDAHEINREVFKYWRAKKMYVIGAGSFGSPAKNRPESMPCLYNLLEVKYDLSSVRVHTRRQLKPDGPWEGWYEWEDPDDKEKRIPYYDISIK